MTKVSGFDQSRVAASTQVSQTVPEAAFDNIETPQCGSYDG